MSQYENTQNIFFRCKSMENVNCLEFNFIHLSFQPRFSWQYGGLSWNPRYIVFRSAANIFAGCRRVPRLSLSLWDVESRYPARMQSNFLFLSVTPGKAFSVLQRKCRFHVGGDADSCRRLFPRRFTVVSARFAVSLLAKNNRKRSNYFFKSSLE